ncbi:MAG: hypothetical protein LDL25_01995 [Hyphomicrobiales bacterium]|uniref:hypothetical protein n=1 Tax=Rhabdaerophilum calidifontis TaxID=2604328 RepID=UPI00123AD6A2|nr:hypothetical protein [Rhabdaerophilum calidifontis]MCA1951687.1 hypothetical protein [Hyphomicrobiales bacterium]MCA1998538.1 hypothetical protein [Hyphomicrobiales bacterium]
MSLAQAILVALLAGFTTALLSGLLTPLAAPILLLSVLAPAPLLIAGFGWHPLVAALGGILAGLIAQLAAGMPAALVVSGMLAIPAFGITARAAQVFLPAEGRPGRDGLDLGRLALLTIMYVALAMAVAAFLFQPDYAALQAQLRRALELAARRIGAEPPGGDLQALVELMAGLILPLSGLVNVLTLAISATLAMQIAERAGRLAYPRPDFRRFRLPGGALILFGLSFFLALSPGYPGLFGELVVVGLAAAFTLQGLAVLHVRTLGMAARGILLTAIWAALVIFGLPALLLILLGMIDHLADFRRGRL